MKKDSGVGLPKGAWNLVIKADHDYGKQHGDEALQNVAKLHFKTTEAVLKR